MVAITVDDHLLLRTYTTKDAPALFGLVHQSRAHLGPWLSWVEHTTKEEHSLRFIENSLHEQEVQEALAMGIFVDNELVGGIGMHQWRHEVKRAQIGYWIGRSHEGTGIMYRSAVAFTSFLFDKVGLNKIELHYAAPNTRSGKLATRLGFRLEGVIRQSMVRNGMIEDLVITGMLRSEWGK